MSRSALAVALALSCAGCSLLTGPDALCGAGALSGTLAASLEGEAVAASCLRGQFAAGTLSVDGEIPTSDGAGPGQIHLSVQGAQPGQTYSFGLGTPGLRATASPVGEAGAAFVADASAGTGRVTVEAVSASGARGTFAFTGVDRDGTPLAVSEGWFEVAF